MKVDLMARRPTHGGLTEAEEAPLDHPMLPDDTATPAASARTLSRRGFLGWARNGVIAAVGLSVLGGAALASPPASGVDAKESEDKDEKESKSKKKKTESKKTSSESSNKKKKKKQKNKAQGAIAASPYGKYIVQGQDKYNCTDFTSQADAQGTLRLVPTDPNNLDRNRDGIACGGTEAFQDGVPGGFMMPPYDINTVPRP
jgi:hypothetical protein